MGKANRPAVVEPGRLRSIVDIFRTQTSYFSGEAMAVIRFARCRSWVRYQKAVDRSAVGTGAMCRATSYGRIAPQGRIMARGTDQVVGETRSVDF